MEPPAEPDAAWSASSRPRAAYRDDLLLSYREQFNVGRRSLLDVLDAQNTRYNVQAQAETARLAKLYAQYRVLAATNRLIEALGVAMPTAAYSDERARFRVNPIPPADLLETACRCPRWARRVGPGAGRRWPGAVDRLRPAVRVKRTGREFHALA